MWASASALTTAGGPVVGGWLTEALGWQWVFAINPPLALIAVGLPEFGLGAYCDFGRRRRRSCPTCWPIICARWRSQRAVDGMSRPES